MQPPLSLYCHLPITMESRLLLIDRFVVALPKVMREKVGFVLTDVADEKDLVIIGGGVAGYVAAIKAGQEGLKVSFLPSSCSRFMYMAY